MNKPTLIVHAGSTKTGSSAIQAGLALNYEALLPLGICAPKSPQHDKAVLGMTTTGNAKALIRYGRVFSSNRTKAVNYIDKYFSDLISSHDASIFILTGEAVPGSIPQEGISDLRRLIEHHFSQSIAIYYIRDCVEHAISQYGEYVKRRGYRKTFSEYSLRYKTPFGRHIRILQQIFDRKNVKVLKYEDSKKTLWQDFLAAACPGALEIPLENPQRNINRSLCFEELEFIRKLNKYNLPRTAMTKAVVSWAQKTHPISSNKLKASKKDVEAILSNNLDEIHFINSSISKTAAPYTTISCQEHYNYSRDESQRALESDSAIEPYGIFIEQFMDKCFGLK